MLGASAGSVAATLFAEPLKAAAPQATSVTPELIEAARKEGKVSYYAAIEINVAERLGKLFEAKYPGISVRGRAFRRRADFPAHRAGAGQWHPGG
jgi:iron(III) transport system substrate-binding protein